MALVVSDSKEMTVIILEREEEAEALSSLLTRLPRLHNMSGAKFSADYPELDELTNAMATKDLGSAYRPNTSSPNYMVDDSDMPVSEAIVREVKNQGMADWLGVKHD